MNLYTKDFQVQLLVHLAKDEDFFRKTGYLRLEDFEMVACQFVLETLRDYYAKFHKLPDFNLLQTHIGYMLTGARTVTQLIPEELPTVAYIMESIATASLNTTYYIAQLPEFLRFVRLTQQIRLHGDTLKQGLPVDELITAISKINTDVAACDDDEDDDDMWGNPEPILDRIKHVRVPTPLQHLNNYTSGGLGLGEVGMVVACPGVGKTTSLINFQAYAVQSGIRTLFLSLELTKVRIKYRYQAISAHIPANYYKVEMKDWPPDVLYRYSLFTNPEYKYFGYCKVRDMSKRHPAIAEIERMIVRWLEKAEKLGKRHECKLVLIDWLDYIDPAGISLSKTARDDVILMKILEQLGMLARKYNIAIWTATQGTRQADGVENLQMKHTAQGYHKNDPVDISVGLAAIDAMGRELQEAKTSDDDQVRPVCDRDLKLSIMKNRDNPPVFFPFYQGPTLRHWNNRKESSTVDQVLSAGKMEEAEKVLIKP